MRESRLWRLLCYKQTPLPSFSHLGPGSIHPDGGFIFVFVCLLIHASSYSGHRRGFRSTTECKSPRRLIHFHPSLVDIQLLSMCPRVSCSQDISVSFSSTGSDMKWPGQRSSNTCLHFMHDKHKLTSHTPFLSSRFSHHFFFPRCLLTLAPDRGYTTRIN